MKDLYGKRQIMVDALYSQMINMPAATVNRVSLRSFYDVTEKHLRSLQALGENINQMQILSMTKSKLPRSILEDIEQMKDEEEEWTVKSFRKRLNKKINALEAADLQISLYKKTDESTILTSSYRLAEDSSHSTGEMLLSSELKKRREQRCIFCEGRHWSDECRSYPDIAARKEKIKDRCYICLRKNHRAKECKLPERSCVHCGESNKEHKDIRKHQTENNLIALGENVVMHTALVTIENPDNRAFKMETRVLLDTGSQRTYITKDLADELTLKAEGEDTYSVYTFGNGKPKELTSPIVSVTLTSEVSCRNMNWQTCSHTTFRHQALEF